MKLGPKTQLSTSAGMIAPPYSAILPLCYSFMKIHFYTWSWHIWLELTSPRVALLSSLENQNCSYLFDCHYFSLLSSHSESRYIYSAQYFSSIFCYIRFVQVFLFVWKGEFAPVKLPAELLKNAYGRVFYVMFQILEKVTLWNVSVWLLQPVELHFYQFNPSIYFHFEWKLLPRKNDTRSACYSSWFMWLSIFRKKEKRKTGHQPTILAWQMHQKD